MKESSKPGAEDSGKNLILIQQFKNLENQWESLKRSKPLQSTRRCSTDSRSNSIASTITTSFDQLMDNSPRGLMSSLQHRKSPSDEILRLRNCDPEVEEKLRERRAAITSGKLKGRRLFEAAEVEIDLDYGDGHHHGVDECEVGSDTRLDMVNGREMVVNVRKNGNENEERRGDNDKLKDGLAKICSSSFDSVSREKVVVERKSAEKRVKRGGSGGRCKQAVAWLAFVLILVVLGVVVIRCNGKFVQEKELILVPT